MIASLTPRSRTRLLAIVGAVAVVGGVGGALLIPNMGSVFGASDAASVAGACATPSAASTAVGATAAAGTAAAAPAGTAATVAPTPSGTAAAPVATARPPRPRLRRPRYHRGDRRPWRPRHTAAATRDRGGHADHARDRHDRDRASATPSATATAPVAAANVSCDIIVPADPLSAAGLATPWQLTGPGGMTPAASGCTTANSANLGAFVQATILDPATGALAVYEPLVITQGTTPAAAPVVPTLPAGAVVTIDCRVQRHQPDPGGRHADRAAAG